MLITGAIDDLVAYVHSSILKVIEKKMEAIKMPIEEWINK